MTVALAADRTSWARSRQSSQEDPPTKRATARQIRPPINVPPPLGGTTYRKRTLDLDRAHAPEVVGDGTNGQVGPFEEALGQFHIGNVFPIVAGAFGEVNEDASKLVTNLARLTAKTDFGKLARPSARKAYQTAEDNHSKHRSRPKASMFGYARWWQNFIPEGYGLLAYIVADFVAWDWCPNPNQASNNSGLGSRSDILGGVMTIQPGKSSYQKGNCQANPPTNQRASNVRRNYRKRTLDLDRDHAPEVVGDGTNGQTGPFEEALGQFYTGNVFPIVAGAVGEVNEAASKLVTNLARLTAKTDFGKLMSPLESPSELLGGTHVAPWGEVAYDLRSKLTHVRVATLVKKIPHRAFIGYDKLIELKLNEGLELIGERSFHGCELLRSMTLPSTVTELGKSAFYDCISLVELQFNEGLEVIGKGAFEHCKSLQNVTLPSTVTVLGDRAFYGCRGLVDLQLNEGLKDIGRGTFIHCTALQSVTTPSTVTKICSEVFVGCSSLVELQLNEGLKVIGDRAFQHCTALRSMALPSSLLELVSFVFRGCNMLVELQLHEGLQVIGRYTFEGCTSLRNVTVPSTVTELAM
ncbi:hypothetical protein THAOC_37660, partial [Thalassiosira oceanica]